MTLFRRLFCLVALAPVLALSLSAEDKAAPTTNKETENKEVDIKKLSEAFGHFIGKNIQGSGLNFDITSLIQGIKNGAEGKPSPMSEQDYEKGMMTLQEKAIKKLSEDNLKAAVSFLKENKGKNGVIELEKDKLHYQVLQEGKGEAVKEHGSPLIQYKGSFIDGSVFGSSEESGGPITLPLDQTIPGFAKGIAGMKEGEKRKLFVHPDIGYGTTGHLPPNSLLIFEVEVIKADSKDKPKDASFNEMDDEDSEEDGIADEDSDSDDMNDDDDDDDDKE